MYSLKSAYGVGIDPESIWSEEDVSQILVKRLFSVYRDLYLTLTNPFIDGDVFVRLKDLKDEFYNYSGTLSDLFAEIGNRALPTVEKIPKYKTSWALFADAFAQGYKVDVNEPGKKPDSTGLNEVKTELTISKPLFNPKKMFDHCLVSVNGFFYPTDHDSKNFYVLGAGTSLLKSRRNQVGILSFQDIGKIEQIPIKESMLSKLDDTVELNREVIISLDPKYQNKSIILCLAGYLIFPNDSNFRKISDNEWLLRTADIPIIERFFESKNYVDYTSLELTKFNNNPDKIDVEEFLSDYVLNKYLTHKQSFIVAVDTPYLVRTKTYLRHSKLPGMFTAYSEPLSLLFVGRGRTAEYWKTYEDGHWAVNVVNSYMPNRTFNSVNEKNREVNAGTDTPHRLYYDSRAFLLNVGVDVLTTP